MKNKIIPLLLLLVFNAGILLQINAVEDYKLCKGFRSRTVSTLSSAGIGLSTSMECDISMGWNFVNCCKESTAIDWCDFKLEDKACKVIVKRDSNPFCITGSIEE
jgi:hypothetical protein